MILVGVDVGFGTDDVKAIVVCRKGERGLEVLRSETSKGKENFDKCLSEIEKEYHLTISREENGFYKSDVKDQQTKNCIICLKEHVENLPTCSKECSEIYMYSK